MFPLVAAAIAAIAVLLVADEKKPKGKSYDDGIREGRESATKEANERAAERKRIETIARKQARMEIGSSRLGRRGSILDLDDDEGPGESVTKTATPKEGAVT